MKKWYFTFGDGRPHRRQYVVMHAESEKDARHMMFMAYGDKWCASYDEQFWKSTDMSWKYAKLAEFHVDDPLIDWEFA